MIRREESYKCVDYIDRQTQRHSQAARNRSPVRHINFQLPNKHDRGSVHHSTVRIKKIQQDATVYQIFIPYLYKAQHVSGYTPHIIRSLKLR